MRERGLHHHDGWVFSNGLSEASGEGGKKVRHEANRRWQFGDGRLMMLEDGLVFGNGEGEANRVPGHGETSLLPRSVGPAALSRQGPPGPRSLGLSTQAWRGVNSYILLR